MHPVNSSKPVRLVDVHKPTLPVNSNKIVHTVLISFNKRVNFKIVCPLNSSKPVHPGNSSKPVRPVDIHQSVCPVNSNKPVYYVDVCKSVCSVDVCKNFCLVHNRRFFFFVYWRHVILFLILFFVLVPVNTSVFNRAIPYIIIFIDTFFVFSGRREPKKRTP